MAFVDSAPAPLNQDFAFLQGMDVRKSASEIHFNNNKVMVSTSASHLKKSADASLVPRCPPTFASAIIG